ERISVRYPGGRRDLSGAQPRGLRLTNPSSPKGHGTQSFDTMASGGRRSIHRRDLSASGSSRTHSSCLVTSCGFYEERAVGVCIECSRLHGCEPHDATCSLSKVADCLRTFLTDNTKRGKQPQQLIGVEDDPTSDRA